MTAPTTQLAVTPEAQAMERQLATLVSTAESLTISTAAEYEEAGKLLPQVKGLLNGLEAQRVRQVRPYNQRVSDLNALYSGPKGTATNAELVIKRAMADFVQRQRDAAAAEQRRLDEAARVARAEAEQRASAERAKAEAEAAELRTLAADATTESAADEAETLAELVEARAQATIAEFEAAADAFVAPVVAVNIPKVAGISTKTNYKFEVVDAEKVERLYLMVNEKAIGAAVRSNGEALMRRGIPGVRIWAEAGIASGSK